MISRETRNLVLAVAILIAAPFVLFFTYQKYRALTENRGTVENTQAVQNIESEETNEVMRVVLEPIKNARERVTKKPFGIYITPQNSPVSPERFTGYHTGTDFEVTEAELQEPVEIYAVCSGQILVKNTVSGYGGVIVQSCNIEGANYTVLYGHLSLATSSVLVGQNISAGQKLAELGAEGSAETSDERKHLHLGIHKGIAVDYRGYVENQTNLSEWVDYFSFLK